jgi:23S rRNA pseudouridine1911/1915/1917 synthase
MACNPAAREHLIQQVRAHTMRREYIAFVEGKPASDTGTWRHLLSLSEDELRQDVAAPGQISESDTKTQEAITYYELLKEYSVGPPDAFVTKLKLRLETGLRHQIRVQAAHSGLPLVGERKYHPGPRLIDFPRQALHAISLTLEHPEQAERTLTLNAALPKDLLKLEHTLLAKRNDEGT